MTTHSHDDLARDVLTRGLAAIGLLGIALIHLLDAIPTFPQLPYKGGLYVGLIVSAIALAGWLVHGASRRAWSAAAGLVAAAMLAFTYSRTVGLPGAADDVGNWSEPLGVAALFVEVAVLSVSAYALAAVMPAIDRAPRTAARRGDLVVHTQVLGTGRQR
ncbi:MAG TPA: hypothetical protein VG388_06325 [Solirubrobacteraceae bacterium]|nr:hypothetical protein [Solirubrobacteraceae bacterium]